ncbi:MAG: long-chain fatty acid--CoA ligase [Pseudomonadota bacterium]
MSWDRRLCPIDHPARWGSYTPDRPALTASGVTWSWADLEARVARTARWLVDDRGLEPGDRVAILAQNHPCFFELAFACFRAGMVLAPLNWRLAPGELDALLSLSGARLLMVDEDSRALLAAMQHPLAAEPTALEALEAPPEGPASLPDRRPLAPLGLEDPALLLFTSGTTGLPKAAVLPVRQLFWNTVNTQLAFELTAHDATVLYTPLFHTGAINVLALPLLQCGGHVVVHRAFEAGAVLREIEQSGITTVFGVPTTLQMLAEHPDFEARDLATLRLLLCGGAPLSVALIRQYQARGVRLTQGFGMTEVGPNCFFLPPDEALTRAGSVGKPIHFCQARVVVGEREAAPGEAGELLLAGPHVCLGYHDDPEATAAAIQDGWFHTGDLVRRDEDGFFYVAGRKKEMFISGGENVYPAEVEVALGGHPAIADCAVVGMPDTRWGEVGCAFVVARDPDAFDPAQVKVWLRERIAHYKVPRAFVVLAELPRNANGKVYKPALVQEARGHAS